MIQNAIPTSVVTLEAGSKLAGYGAHWLQGRRQLVVMPPPGNRRDAGEMTPQEAKILRTAAMVQAVLL